MNTTAIQAHNQCAAAVWSSGGAAYERISHGIAAVHPYGAGGAYVNFMMDEGAGRVAASYRGNYARLAAVKKRYDPGNLFRVNQNIAPA